MGRICGTYGGENKQLRGFGGGNLKRRVYLEDQSVDGR
jgi:hypothetical protein